MWHMSFAAVASGSNVGEVWVDDVLFPTFVMVWSEYLSGFSLGEQIIIKYRQFGYVILLMILSLHFLKI